jgi:hypothetical protein
VARLGHATRWFTLGELCERLGAAHSSNRLHTELGDLDRISLLAIDGVRPDELDRFRLDVLSRLLRHRRDRGSVALAGAAAAQWRNAAQLDVSCRAVIADFLDACETIDLSGSDPATVPTAELPGRAESGVEASGESEVTSDTGPDAVRA